ncbi:MAG: hypothetical protein HY052_07105 [Proteobacteria bacterium]|nr:hypothetical protein [Pseudomonadota bacterium]
MSFKSLTEAFNKQSPVAKGIEIGIASVVALPFVHIGAITLAAGGVIGGIIGNTFKKGK